MVFSNKRIASLVMGFVIFAVALFSGVEVAKAEFLFPDVSKEYEYAKAIYSLVEEGIINGETQSDGEILFRPYRIISRAEVVKLITIALIGEKEANLKISKEFPDVPKEHWASKYVNYAVETGIVNCYPDGTFKPEAEATYGEVVKMLVCAKDYAGRYKTTDPWYDGYIDIAYHAGITGNIIHPGNWGVSRALTAQLIYNFKNVKPIPKLYLAGDVHNLPLTKEDRKISVWYESSELSFGSYAKIKLQGTSSMAYAKKNYTINFYKDSSFSEKLKVDVGWGKQSKYCLKANWIDKTHARNVVTAKLVTQMQKKYGVMETAPENGAIDGFPVEVYINGDFQGLFTMNIPKDEWMFNMDKDNPDNIVVGGDDWGPETQFEAMPNLKMWEVEVGEENDYTLQKLNRLFDFVINSSDEEFKKNFGEYLSLDSTLNYYIMTDFAYLIDNLGKNMLLATYDGKVWYPSLYDLDSSWGTNTAGDGLFGYEENAMGFWHNNLFERLEKCFPHELATRYFELRKDILTKNNILFKFNAFANLVPEETYRKELNKWGPNLPGYGISQIESYLDVIVPRLDAKYADFKIR